MKLLDQVAEFFSPERAEAVAAEMQAGDDEGWTYVADHDPKGTGYSRVKVYDEDSEFVDFV